MRYNVEVKVNIKEYVRYVLTKSICVVSCRDIRSPRRLFEVCESLNKSICEVYVVAKVDSFKGMFSIILFLRFSIREVTGSYQEMGASVTPTRN